MPASYATGTPSACTANRIHCTACSMRTHTVDKEFGKIQWGTPYHYPNLEAEIPSTNEITVRYGVAQSANHGLGKQTWYKMKEVLVVCFFFVAVAYAAKGPLVTDIVSCMLHLISFYD